MLSQKKNKWNEKVHNIIGAQYNMQYFPIQNIWKEFVVEGKCWKTMFTLFSKFSRKCSLRDLAVDILISRTGRYWIFKIFQADLKPTRGANVSLPPSLSLTSNIFWISLKRHSEFILVYTHSACSWQAPLDKSYPMKHWVPLL